MRILVTGANGFVGRALCRTLLSTGTTVIGAIRDSRRASQLPDGTRPILMKSIDDLETLDQRVGSVDGVVHLAARVHQMKESAKDPLAAFREVNTHGTVNLARWSAARGVKRFVFVSSVKVNGEGQDYSERHHTYTEQDPANPQDPYGISKWEAEQSLRVLATQTGQEIVILRPTLIYGPNVKANFLQLLRMVNRGVPLPLRRVYNLRSLLYLGNLTDAIRVCLSHPSAAGETFLVSDGEDLSTPELIRGLANALHKPARLFPIAPRWLQGMGTIMGQSKVTQKLLGTLRVDSGKIRKTLGWQPPFRVIEGLQATADAYLEGIKSWRWDQEAAS